MMKKIYIEKIRQTSRFGLIDEEGRKTPCGTLWSDAQRETFKRLLNGGNNLAFMAWGGDGVKKSALWAKWTDARGQEKLCKLGTFGKNAPFEEFVAVANATAHDNECCATCAHYKLANVQQIKRGMGVCTLINRERYCLFKCGDWSMI